MKFADKEHRKLINLAAENRHKCSICERHVKSFAGLLAEEKKVDIIGGFTTSLVLVNLNSNNLLKHLRKAHGYRPKRWYQIWRIK